MLLLGTFTCAEVLEQPLCSALGSADTSCRTGMNHGLLYIGYGVVSINIFFPLCHWPRLYLFQSRRVGN